MKQTTKDSTVRDLVKKQKDSKPPPVEPEAPPPGGDATVTAIGRLVTFNCQTGVYSTHDDGVEVPKGSEFIAHAAAARDGWIRFPDQDSDDPVKAVTGGIFDPAWTLPPRSAMGEMDKSEWRIGLSGQPESPWRQTVSLPLENTISGAFFNLSGHTPTVVNSLYRFLNEYRLLRRRSPDALPVIRLASGTYKSKYGSLVHKPVLIQLRRVEGGAVEAPDTRLPTLLDDAIPPF